MSNNLNLLLSSRILDSISMRQSERKVGGRMNSARKICRVWGHLHNRGNRPQIY